MMATSGCQPGNQQEVLSDELMILVVDDDEKYNNVLSRSLTRRGYCVASAFSPEEALKIADRIDPEVIILDLNLAGKSGLSIIRPLLERSPEVLILVLTGYATIQTAVNAIKLGAKQYLSKPANVDEILRAIQKGDDQIDTQISDERMTVQKLEREYILQVLSENKGNIAATARALKMHRRTLQRKLAKLSPTG